MMRIVVVVHSAQKRSRTSSPCIILWKKNPARHRLFHSAAALWHGMLVDVIHYTGPCADTNSLELSGIVLSSSLCKLIRSPCCFSSNFLFRFFNFEKNFIIFFEETNPDLLWEVIDAGDHGLHPPINGYFT